MGCAANCNPDDCLYLRSYLCNDLCSAVVALSERASAGGCKVSAGDRACAIACVPAGTGVHGVTSKTQTWHFPSRGHTLELAAKLASVSLWWCGIVPRACWFRPSAADAERITH